VISLPVIESREEESFVAIGEECFDGMAIEVGGGLFI
jgi:hypothetical protein